MQGSEWRRRSTQQRQRQWQSMPDRDEIPSNEDAYSSVIMNASSTAAAWLSFAVTAVGLGGLISQANAINDKMDPFHAHRNVEYLGVWFQRQQRFPWWVLAKPPPSGPVIKASLSDGFCGVTVLHLTRLPVIRAGKAGWAAVLSIFHCDPASAQHSLDEDSAEKGEGERKLSIMSMTTEVNGAVIMDGTEWHYLQQRHLIKHQAMACTIISRTTLLTMMVITNARMNFQHSDASGFRGGYASYSGQWYITWPIGQEAVVKFAPHDSHSAATDVYPPSFIQRVDCCVQMLAGVVSAPSASLQVAFCGRKPAGTYTLQYVPKGFPGAHGSRHLYNMMGGKVYEVDFLSASQQSSSSKVVRTLELPSKDQAGPVHMQFTARSEEIIQHALDCLPWTSMSWSVHRGMRDILMAYAKPVFNRYRQELADLLRRTVAEEPHLLDRRGWNSAFVRSSMGEMAASAILAGSGNSGDLVRVVADVVLATVGDREFERLDDVSFWRKTDAERSLDNDGVVALMKVFVLEWSNEFDYQLYHNLPMSLYFG